MPIQLYFICLTIVICLPPAIAFLRPLYFRQHNWLHTPSTFICFMAIYCYEIIAQESWLTVQSQWDYEEGISGRGGKSTEKGLNYLAIQINTDYRSLFAQKMTEPMDFIPTISHFSSNCKKRNFGLSSSSEVKVSSQALPSSNKNGSNFLSCK